MIVGVSAGGIAELFSEIQGPLSALDRVFDLQTEVKSSSSLNLTKESLKNFKNIPQNHDISFENLSFLKNGQVHVKT